MSHVGPEHRSFLPMEDADLRRVLEIARRDREHFFATHPGWARLYAGRLLCTALCQGAASHYVGGQRGINDFDVYSFYRRHPDKHWYARRLTFYDFGHPKFGRSADKPDFIGRRVDCLGRSIEAAAGEDPAAAVRRYLREGRTQTARLLAAQAVVLLEPGLGTVIWRA